MKWRSLTYLSLWLSAFTLHATPLYWTAEKAGTQLMLLGSIHVGRADLYPLPKPVMQFLSSSDALVVEADISTPPSLDYPSQKSTQDWLTDEQRKKLNHIAEQLRLNPDRLLSLPPWRSALFLQYAQLKKLGYQASQGIDHYLIEQAQNERIPVIGLESAQQQLDILAYGEEDGLHLLLSALEDFTAMPTRLKRLVKAWKQGDAEQLQRLSDTQSLPDALQHRLLYERNQRWAEQLSDQQKFASGHRYLVVVGALHLLGPNNVLEYLHQQGFTLSSPTPSSSY